MKRTVAILLCLFLIGTLALSVFAAGSAHMSLSSSSSTVYRGETFNLTVTLTNDQPVSNGGIVLSYDSSIFELIGGTCGVSNATLAEVSPANGGGVFLLQADEVVSGTIFTIEMKVKTDAPFGSYNISGTPSLSIDCSLSGTSVTVGCKHVFANHTKVDDAEHESTCSICGETQKEAHAWDAGTVTKEATCKEPGSKTLKCTVCAAEKVEEIPKNDDHPFSDWESDGISGHSRTCSVCGVTDSAEHDWYTGNILEEATCQTTGRKSVYCNDCGASAEQEIPLSDHDYAVFVSMTDTDHTYKCTHCTAEVTVEHVFGDELQNDAQSHYYVCEICGGKKDQEEHVPGPMATEETDQVCTVCNRVLRPKGAHEHEYSATWSYDSTNHWHECAGCPERNSEGAHVFDNDCDPDCNTCGMTRDASHTPSPEMTSDATGHWYACQTCGEKLEFAAHTPGPEATVTSAQTCTVCRFEIAPIVVHDHAYNSDGTKHFHKCACGKELAADAETCAICAEAHKTFPWWIVCIAEAVVFIVILVCVILSKKKDSVDDEEEDEDEDEEEEASDDTDDVLKKYLSE